MGYGLYDPYSTMRSRRDPRNGDENDRDERNRPPKPPPPTSSYPYQSGTGDFTDGPEFDEPAPPRPTPDMLDRARAGTESDQDRATIRAWREYAQRKGAWEDQMLQQGIIPRMKKSTLNMMNTYGTRAPNIDIQGGYIWDTRQGQPSDRYADGKTPAGGGWVKMDPDEWKRIREFNKRYFDTKQGQAAGQAWGGNNYVAEQQRLWLQNWGRRYGHATWDPRYGVYYSGHGNGNYTFLDKYGKETQMPSGWTDPGEGMMENRYNLNAPGNTNEYPSPVLWDPYATNYYNPEGQGGYQPPNYGNIAAPPQQQSAANTSYGQAWGGAASSKSSAVPNSALGYNQPPPQQAMTSPQPPTAPQRMFGAAPPQRQRMFAPGFTPQTPTPRRRPNSLVAGL